MNRSNNFLKLVVNSDSQKDAHNQAKESSAQFEMFAQDNALYFTSAKELLLDDVKELIEKHQFHHIVDLRDVPYLNFGKLSRDVFFRLLSDYAVEYLSLYSLASNQNKNSINDLFHDREKANHFSKELSDWIKNGPTLVLINKKREQDSTAASFSKFLADSKIKYSEIAN